MERTRYWGLSFAPITRMVLVEGRQVPCAFKILGDGDEEFLTSYMATLPLEIPDMSAPQKGLEFFWQAELQQRMERLRAQAEARALVALALVSINGQPFDTLSFEERIAEIRGNPDDPDQPGWPPRLVRQLVDIIGVVSRAPIVGLEALEQDPDFVFARETGGEHSLRVESPALT